MKFLKVNIVVFTWNAYDVPGIYLELVCHQLNVNLKVVPRKHPLQRSSKNHAEVVKIVVNKLKQAGAMKEIFYPEWLANTVVVKRKTGNGECAWISLT